MKRSLNSSISDNYHLSDFVILITLSLFVIFINAVWLYLDNRPPHWDAAIHLMSSIRYYEIFNDPQLSFLKKIHAFFEVDNYYPPLVPFITAVFYFFFPSTPDSAVMLNSIYILILIFSTYGIGRFLMDKQSALIAAIGISSFPIFLTNSRDYMFEVPITALVSLGVYLLLKANYFSNRFFSTLFGIASAIGMLTKWTYFFFIFPLFLYHILKGFSFKEDRGERGINLLLSISILVILSAPWYVGNLSSLILSFKKWGYETGVNEGDPPVFTAASIFFYFNKLGTQLHSIWLILFFVGIILAFSKGRRLNSNLIIWVVVPYIILTLLRNKDSRYTMPYLPAVALVGACSLSHIKSMLTKKILISGIILYSIVFVPMFSFGHTTIRFPFLGTVIDSFPPDRGEWGIYEALNIIRKDNKNNQRAALVRIIPDYPYFQRFCFEYLVKRDSLPIKIYGVTNFPTFTDYVVTKTGDQGGAKNSEEIMRNINSQKSEFHMLFSKIYEFPLPDGTTGSIYRRDPQSIKEFSGEYIVNFIKENISESLYNFARETKGMKISIIPVSDEGGRRGEFSDITIEAESATVGDYKHGNFGLPIKNLRFTVSGANLNLYKLFKEKKIEPLSMGSVSLQGEINERDILDLLKNKVHDISVIDIKLDNGMIWMDGIINKIGIGFHIGVEPELMKGGNIYLKIRGVKIGWISLPNNLVQLLIRKINPLIPEITSSVTHINLKYISIKNGVISIG